MTTTTPIGVPIVDCALCGHRHPATRTHCPICGLATLFGHEHDVCTCGAPYTDTAGGRLNHRQTHGHAPSRGGAA